MNCSNWSRATQAGSEFVGRVATSGSYPTVRKHSQSAPPQRIVRGCRAHPDLHKTDRNSLKNSTALMQLLLPAAPRPACNHESSRVVVKLSWHGRETLPEHVHDLDCHGLCWFRIGCFITKSGQDARAPGKERTRNETYYP